MQSNIDDNYLFQNKKAYVYYIKHINSILTKLVCCASTQYTKIVSMFDIDVHVEQHSNIQVKMNAAYLTFT